MSIEREYGDRPFYAGAVLRGIRTFGADRAGVLHGMTYPAAWRPGENRKQCFSQMPKDPNDRGVWYMGCPCGQCNPVARGTVLMKDTEHPVMTECMCGFYAITDSYNEYMTVSYGASVPRIEGIVEGYGTVVVGAKGFRAEKAKIVALVIPEKRRSGAPLPSWFDLSEAEQRTRQKRCEYERNRRSSMLMGLATVVSPVPFRSANPVLHVTDDIEVNFTHGSYEQSQRLERAFRDNCTCLDGLAERDMQWERAKIDTYAVHPNTTSPVVGDRIAERYGVPIYEEMDAALADFPIIGQKQFKPPASDSACLSLSEELTAGPVDPDGAPDGVL